MSTKKENHPQPPSPDKTNPYLGFADLDVIAHGHIDVVAEKDIKVEGEAIALGKDATKGVARVGDTVTIYPTDLKGKLTAPSGPVTASGPITCKITSASSKVKAE